MKSFKLIENVYVPGRGKICLIKCKNEDIPKPGDTVLIDGIKFEVSGVELSKILTDPPFYAEKVGLLGKYVKDFKYECS